MQKKTVDTLLDTLFDTLCNTSADILLQAGVYVFVQHGETTCYEIHYMMGRKHDGEHHRGAHGGAGHGGEER